MLYYLIYNGSFKIITKNKLDDGDEQYADIFTNQLAAYEKLISYFQEDKERWEEVNKKVNKEYRTKWLELMWKYEPENIKKLPGWYRSEVSEITKGKVEL